MIRKRFSRLPKGFKNDVQAGEELAGSCIQDYAKAVNRWLEFDDGGNEKTASPLS
jgi:hypothetical protein